MPRTIFHVLSVILVVLLLDPVAVCAETPIKAKTALEDLYSSRLTFTEKGEPEVSVGLMDGQKKVSLSAKADFSVRFYNGRSSEMIIGSADGIAVNLVSSTQGKTHYNIVVAGYKSDDRSGAEAELKVWQERGIKAEVLKIGSVLGLGDTIISNTEFRVSVASFENEKQAEKEAQKIKDNFDVDAEVFGRIVTLPTATIEVSTPDGFPFGRSQDLIKIRTVDGSPITVRSVEYDKGFRSHGVADRSYRGSIFVAVDRHGTLSVVNALSLESLAAGTVPAETFSSAPLEALKAQAVASRGQLLAKLGRRHLADPFHLCASQHCQAYAGMKAETKNTNQAVVDTSGMFLVSSGRLVDTVYSANAGGYTENNEVVWHQMPNKDLRGRLDVVSDTRFVDGITTRNLNEFLEQPPDGFVTKSGYNISTYRWQRVLSAEDVTRLVSKKHNVGNVIKLVPGKRGVSGRLKNLHIVGTEGEVDVGRELAIRRLLGGLPSALIAIRRYIDPEGKPLRFEINGAGFGHGVGMCQTGAIGRARMGQSYETILSHYYNGAGLKKLY